MRDRKLIGLTADQKQIWFQRRLDMTYLQPLGEIWTPGSPVFRALFDDHKPCSFSIAAMSSMLNGIEMLGYLIDPPANQKNKGSRRRFLAFVSTYMPDWNVTVAGPRGPLYLPACLWKWFRNGIAHRYQISEYGSLEFLRNQRYRIEGPLFQICPLNFFSDLKAGITKLFSDIRTSASHLARFERGFDYIYPSN
jgi:hypothetical protein